jgi:4-aminobutyrate--pyruvate transaminase
VLSSAPTTSSRDIAHVVHPFTDLLLHQTVGPLTITRGNGIYVYDESDKEYIEGVAGLWCTSLGFSQQTLVDAAIEQYRTLPFYHSFFHKSTIPLVNLAEQLSALAPPGMSKVFFANSGSEANDSAIKIAWYYNNAVGRPAKKKIISRERAFHGVTIASGSLTGVPNIHRNFDLPIGGMLHTDCPDIYRNMRQGEDEEGFATRLAEALERLIVGEGPDTVAAFIADPVICAAGVLMPPKTYFQKINAVLKRYDVLFIIDEVISGFGRTGNMFACETFGLRPDLLTCAKGLTSAYFPMSAVIVSDALWDAIVGASHRAAGFWHGFTSSGHPVGAAIALRVLETLLDGGVLEHVRRISPYFQVAMQRLVEHSLVGDIRGVGLLGAIQIAADKPAHRPFEASQGVGAYCIQRAQDHGLIAMVRGEAICLAPPLIITEPEIDQMMARLKLALDDTAAALAAGKLG